MHIGMYHLLPYLCHGLVDLGLRRELRYKYKIPWLKGHKSPIMFFKFH